MKDPAVWTWAYLHNELAPKEKALFEQTLFKDPALRLKFEELRATHEQLSAHLPHLVDSIPSNRVLGSLLLAQWEAEHPEYATDDAAEPPRRKILHFALPLAAAAAAAILLLSLPYPSIHWQHTVCGAALQLRGETAATPQYTPTQLKHAARELQDAVNTAGPLPSPWNLQVSLQELIDGALTVEVEGHLRKPFWKANSPRDTRTSRVWNKNFQTLETFRQNIPRFGKQIADDLAAQDHP
jgi:hypothetical protein